MLKDTDSLISNAKALNLSPEEYRTSRQRIEILSAMIKNGEQAQTVRDLVKAVKQEIEKEVTEKLRDPKADTNVLRGYLKGIDMVDSKMEAIIQLADKKRKVLDDIKKNP